MYRVLVIVFTVWAIYNCLGLAHGMVNDQSTAAIISDASTIGILMATALVFWMTEIIRTISEFFNRWTFAYYEEELDGVADSERGTKT